MNESKISVRYAKAIFELAREKNNLEKIREDMDFVYGVTQSVPEFSDIMANPVVKIRDKRNIVQTIFQSQVNELTFKFLLLIIDNKREAFMKDISRMFFSLYKKHKGVTTAVLTIPVAVTDEVRSKIIQQIEQKYRTTVELSTEIDKNIIGGFILRFDDIQYDASVASQLKKFKKEMLGVRK